MQVCACVHACAHTHVLAAMYVSTRVSACVCLHLCEHYCQLTPICFHVHMCVRAYVRVCSVCSAKENCKEVSLGRSDGFATQTPGSLLSKVVSFALVGGQFKIEDEEMTSRTHLEGSTFTEVLGEMKCQIG